MIHPTPNPSATPKGNARSSGYARAGAEFYQEPRRAVEALLDVEEFDGGVWDPACGDGNIPEACRARKMHAFGTDLVDRGYASRTIDFLNDRSFSTGVAHIITNPPFNLAVEFTLRALELVDGKVAILQRLSWLEGERRYQRLWRLGHLMRVWQFRSRISMPPGGQGIEAKGGSVAYAWFVFSRGHKGAWTGGWLP